ncbi:hypothetical protein AAVH_30361 [Aphelenchoides avenae]|nr:hypothetical protein AAVH_30361 [Aphelenchus avenae]
MADIRIRFPPSVGMHLSVIGAPTENCENDVHAEVDGGKTWVLIVAGSNTRFGGDDPESSLAYAIKASAYRAYHVLRDRGIPKEQIVLLSWDDAASIEGTENDNVFVYFMDHGKVGAFFVGDGSEFITKKDFNNTLTKLHNEKKYSQPGISNTP